VTAVNMFMRYKGGREVLYRENREAWIPELSEGGDDGRVVTLRLEQSDLETLRGVLEIFRSEWNMNLAKSIMQDDLTGISTAEAVLRKIDPLLKLFV